MITSTYCRLLTVCLLASMSLVACTRHRAIWRSSTLREIEEVRNRSVPNDGAVVRMSEPVRNNSSVRSTWEIQTKSNSGEYFQWLKTELGPGYRTTSQTLSAISLVREIEGDSYTVTARSAESSNGALVAVEFAGYGIAGICRPRWRRSGNLVRRLSQTLSPEPTKP